MKKYLIAYLFLVAVFYLFTIGVPQALVAAYNATSPGAHIKLDWSITEILWISALIVGIWALVRRFIGKPVPGNVRSVGQSWGSATDEYSENFTTFSERCPAPVKDPEPEQQGWTRGEIPSSCLRVNSDYIKSGNDWAEREAARDPDARERDGFQYEAYVNAHPDRHFPSSDATLGNDGRQHPLAWDGQRWTEKR